VRRAQGGYATLRTAGASTNGAFLHRKTTQRPSEACTRNTLAQASSALCGIRAIRVGILRQSCRASAGATTGGPLHQRGRDTQDDVTVGRQRCVPEGSHRAYLLPRHVFPNMATGIT